MKTLVKEKCWLVGISLFMMANVVSEASQLNSANALGPLFITDSEWSNFELQLDEAVDMGIDAVATDVWWGEVEPATDCDINANDCFDWSRFDDIVSRLEARGLRWAPIISFHHCGGNVGDGANCGSHSSVISVPDWIWNHFTAQGISENDLQYRSEQGNFSREYVSLWADQYVREEYKEFMEAFEQHFAAKAHIIDEINIGAGPTGELRYPSYNQHDSGTGFPTRGAFQAYGRLAVDNFRQWALARHGGLSGVNSAWGKSLSNENEITPPPLPGDPNVDDFFKSGDYQYHSYGKDIIEWYNQSLTAHGIRMYDVALEAFDGAFRNIPLGMKIPGVHWKVNDPTIPRAAEITSGLIHTSIDFYSESTGHGYAPLIGVWSHFNRHPRQVVLHYTALEKHKSTEPPGAFADPDALVFWIGAEAGDQHVIIKGENALEGGISGGNAGFGWHRISEAFRYSTYNGLSALRLATVTEDSGANIGYRNFIFDFKDPGQSCGTPSMNLRGHFNGWSNTSMDCDTHSGTWVKSGVSIGSGPQAIKFDVDGSWSDNYGDNNGDGIGDTSGANIPVVDGVGTYRISFHPQTQQYSIVREDGLTCLNSNMFLRGTHNGWTTQSMSCGNGIWEVTFISAGGGQFKFDVHGDWDENYGDSNYDFIGDASGDDIRIPAGSGSYRVTFNDRTRVYTVKKM